jgi:ABC-type branched-subunit amino acid transport system ATPase component/signal transduction histidine kinase
MALLPSDKSQNLLQLRNIHLDYGQVKVLKDVSLSLGHSEVHAIVGEHGTGKSSLASIISGMVKPKKGSIVFNDQEYRMLSLKKSLKMGIEMVYQNLMLNENFSVAENIFLGREQFFKMWSWEKKRSRLKATKALLAEYGFDLDPSMSLKQLSLSDRALVDLIKHIHANPKLLILDETLEKLAPATLSKILNLLRSLKEKGMSILFITHRVDDIYNFADRVTILKNGEILITDSVKNIDKFNLVKLAYTQFPDNVNMPNLNKEFYKYLKYNEAILRNLPVNLIVTDSNKQIKLINKSCKKYFNLKKPHYFDVPLDNLLSSSNDQVQEKMNQIFRIRKEKTFYQIPITFNEKSIISSVKIFPIFDGTFFMGHITIIEDMTEYDQLQKKMLLSEELASVGLLAAGLAHEINNPLEIIFNYLSYIKYKSKAPEVEKTVVKLHEEVSYIAKIISNLQSFSDHDMISDEATNINQEINNIINLIKYNAKYQHITIDYIPYPRDLIINVNRHEIKQVILNLLKNSFEAIEPGGKITIATDLKLINGEQHVIIIFEDTGTGIVNENLNNIFLPFYSTKKGNINNLGLGLSISHSIITKNQGTISVQNMETVGCQFEISFPQSNL